MSQPEPLISLAIVLVNYYTYDDTEAFLAAQTPSPGLRLIVVDNTPHAEINQEALDRMNAIAGVTYLVPTPENRGYAGAAHYALNSLPDLQKVDYFALSNTDLSYNAAQLQRQLTQMAPGHGGVGAIAPRLIHPDGSEKPQLHYVTKPSRAHYERLVGIFSNYWLAVAHRISADLKRKAGFGRDADTRTAHLFAPHGALMIVSRAYLQHTAGFDHLAFLFCEEVFVGAQCEQAGLSCIYEPQLTYSHRSHGAMGAIPSRRIIGYLRDAHKAVLPLLN